MKLELARLEHIDQISNLVNQAYRGKTGWTKETDLVQGNRITPNEIKSIILNPNTHLLIYPDKNNIIACICIEKINHDAYIGLFAVTPKNQSKGIGKLVLQLAEQYAINKFTIDKFVMVVVSQRKELISYYQRRGYTRIGKIKKYPININVGTPKVANLTIEYLEKNLSIN
ncbi:GNAT family N-acetyltransferase [Candidatus Marithrix sp. Canyon 246]|uniref:GNAT family N-acetyltransferase n=1 Tax=Candidatus Marithrix sp. Canyon 246 TaxID=1827136 RepID=UPI00084A11CE|nr:GNAT family N-acetyltransferase [Candidatus Marithrix sp. Canyon 246]